VLAQARCAGVVVLKVLGSGQSLESRETKNWPVFPLHIMAYKNMRPMTCARLKMVIGVTVSALANLLFELWARILTRVIPGHGGRSDTDHITHQVVKVGSQKI